MSPTISPNRRWTSFAAKAGTVDARSGRKPDELAKDLADADALIVRSATKVTKDLLAAAPKLRIIGRAGTGVDNIDMPAASGKGVLVVNAPGANSIAVAEHALALMLSLARSVPAADQAMKAGKWEKKKFMGTELRNKTLGIAGLGRIGQEVATRAPLVRHEDRRVRPVHLGGRRRVDRRRAADARRTVRRTSDYLTLHMPSTPETKNLFNDERFAKCKPGIRIINTARGELIDEAALGRAIESGHRRRRRHRRVPEGAAGRLDAAAAGRRSSPRPHLPHRPRKRRNRSASIRPARFATSSRRASSATPSTSRPFRPTNCSGCSRGCVWPKGSPRWCRRWGRRVSSRSACATTERWPTIARRELLASSAAAGVLRPILSGGVSIVNARAAAKERGIEITETRSSRPRDFASLVSLKLHTSDGERWAEGTVFEPNNPRLVSVRGINVEAPLAGTLLIISNDDQPGVIGEVGSILGKHGVNIANFALGRNESGRDGRGERGRGIDAGRRTRGRGRRHSKDCRRPRRLARPAVTVGAALTPV